MYPSQTREQFMRENIVSCAYSCQSLVQVFIYSFVFKYCVGCCTQLLLLHSSLVVNGTRWQVGWG